MKTYLYLFCIALFVSCISGEENVNNDFSEIDYSEKNEADILKYLKDNNLTAEKSNTGLYYIIENEGNGTRPEMKSNVTVVYKGYFLNEEVFDEGKSEGITFNLQQVIAGWTEGITYFKEGGNGMLLVPSKLGYGSRGRGRIPGGAVLVFDIKLLKVQ